MASISTDSTGNRRILFVRPDDLRKTIRLGKMPMRAAQSFKTKVEYLLAAAIAGQAPDTETAAWLAKLDNKTYAKLVAVGLVAPRQPEPGTALDDITLGVFLDQYIRGRTDIKPSTRTNFEQVRRNLLEFFEADRPLRAITPGDADEFRVFLMDRLSENTVRRNCGRAKQFFRAAVRKRLIQENPFADMKGCGVKANPSRFYYVTREEARKVLDACPDAQWQLLFALSRFGGLRCPSEHLGLRWGDVDWERNRIRVYSPKTEHYEGKESREIPIFPELRPYLEQVFDEAEPGTEYIITRYRDRNSNLRTQLERIISKADLEPWPKLFQNLRSTRETELAEQYPLHVVTAWLGNTTAVAVQHYLQVTDAHFEHAAKTPAEGCVANSGAPAAQIPAQHISTSKRQHGQETQKASENQGFSHVLPDVDAYCTSVKAPRQGLEPWT